MKFSIFASLRVVEEAALKPQYCWENERRTMKRRKKRIKRRKGMMERSELLMEKKIVY